MDRMDSGFLIVLNPGQFTGKAVCNLPSCAGSIISVHPLEPHFRELRSAHDLAWIENTDGRLLITPTHKKQSFSMDGSSEEAVFVNGFELRRPIDLWPCSRIALMQAKLVFFLRSPTIEARLQTLIEAAALAAHEAILTRRYLLSHHLDRQTLRITRADQRIVRQERDIDAKGKQAAALETKATNWGTRAAGLRKEAELAQIAVEEQRLKGGDPASLKDELKRVKLAANDAELQCQSFRRDAARAREDEARVGRERDEVLAERLELVDRLNQAERWAKNLTPALRATARFMGPDAQVPLKGAVLAQAYPQGLEGDERAELDACLSDPEALERQRWLDHLLAAQQFAHDLHSAADPRSSGDCDGEAAKEFALAETESGGEGGGRQGQARRPTWATAGLTEPAARGSLSFEIAVEELVQGRTLTLAEIADVATAAGAREVGKLAQASQGRLPFVSKQRVSVYEASSGSWLTARVLDCTHTEVLVVLEATKTERVVPVAHTHDWLEHLRLHPHLWKAWKARAPPSSNEPRDRAAIIGNLLCPREGQAVRSAWLHEMRPHFEAVLARHAHVLEASMSRRPWSHRFKTWRDPRFLVPEPRLPTPADAKMAWLRSLAPRSFVDFEAAAKAAAEAAAEASSANDATLAAAGATEIPTGTAEAKTKDAEEEEEGLAFDDGTESDSDSHDEDEGAVADFMEEAPRIDKSLGESSSRGDGEGGGGGGGEGGGEVQGEFQGECEDGNEVTRAARAAVGAARVADARRNLVQFRRHDGNREALCELERLSSAGLPRHLLIFGAPGSGKQSCAELLVRLTVAAQVARAEGLEAASEEHVALVESVAASLSLELPTEVLKSEANLKQTLSAFGKKPLPVSLFKRLIAAAGKGARGRQAKPAVLTRFIILRDFERVAASLQMVLVHRITEVEEYGIRFIFLATNASSVVAPLRAHLLPLHMACLPIAPWLERLLTICVAEKVGYERDAIALIVDLARGDLGAAVELLQRTFVEAAFVSRANVVRVVRALLARHHDSSSAQPAPTKHSPPKLTLSLPLGSASALSEEPRQAIDESKVAHVPRRMLESSVLGKQLRCRVCTLPPPCRHMSAADQARLARARIAELKESPGNPCCPSFVLTGACEAMNTLGYCRLHHPSDLFEFVPAPRRCPVCTIVEPCRTCQWFFLRKAVAKTVIEAAAELADLKHKGERSSVTLSKYRFLFDREVARIEEVLDDAAKWLNCAHRSLVEKHSSDAQLVQGKYSTDEKECRLRFETVSRRWDAAKAKLTLWLSGQSAKRTGDASGTGNVAEASGRARYSSMARVESRRYMPSATELVAESNGAAEWDLPRELPRESPVVHVNTAVIKMGLGERKTEAELKKEAEIAKEAEKKRREAQELELRRVADANRRKMSIFSR